MGMYDKCPCRYCVPPKRHLGCHGDCLEKKQWDQDLSEIKKTIYEDKERHQQSMNVLINSAQQGKKRINKRGK